MTSGGALLLLGVLAATDWRDPSRHQVGFVTVDEGVRLELLDWGGGGRPLVLLAGAGHTAHVYDELAPKLTDSGRVFVLTRRGFGASSRPPSGYDDQRLADDLLRALDQAKIREPVLIGHSMAGGEMTTLARQHPDRVAGLVYLDAIGDLETEPPADAEWAALAQQVPRDLRPRPACDPVDTSSFAAFRRTRTCPMGFILPESELRQQFHEVDGQVGGVTAPGWVMRAIGKGQVFRKDFSNIRVPVLVLMELPRFPEGYTPKSDEERALVDRFVQRSRVVFGRQTARVTRSVREARVVDVPGGGHYLWITREAQVLREIRAFVRTVP